MTMINFGVVEILLAVFLLNTSAAYVLHVKPLPVFRSFTRTFCVGLIPSTLLILLLQAFVVPPTPEYEVTNRPVQLNSDHYVSSDKCQACHTHNYATWHASYHRTMTQVAKPGTVLGDFNGEEFNVDGHRYTLERTGDQLWVEMDDPDWEEGSGAPPRIRRQIVMTTGSHHYQVYWYATGHTRKIAMLPLVYLMEAKQWIPRKAAFLTPPHQFEPAEKGRWNLTCNKCHTTHTKARLLGPDDMDTVSVEFGISCESCHGPAEGHVRGMLNPISRYNHQVSQIGESTMVVPNATDKVTSSQICGQCHSIFATHTPEEDVDWSENGFRYRPGRDLHESKHIIKYKDVPPGSMLEKYVAAEPNFWDDRYWSDGMVRVSGREYNALLDTPCYQRGDLSCLSCHTMHKPADDPRSLKEWANDQLITGMESNQACYQCHQDYKDNLQQHTHHSSGSGGSLCYNCHMPHTAFGLLKAIRSHQIDSPSVASSVQTGRPNACNLCHLNKTLEWTAEYLQQWYGVGEPQLSGDEKTVDASVLWLLKGDAGQRALIAWSMGWNEAQEASGTNWMPPFLALTMEDPYDAIRYISYRSLKTIPGFESFDFDFTAPREDLFKSRMSVMKQWQEGVSTIQSQPARLSSIIGKEEPTIFERLPNSQQVIERLLQERDNKPVYLRE